MEPGELVSGKYRLQRLLGSGGMGSVWAARNQLTDRDFAIKFLLPRLASNQEALQRFFHEARACGQIKHPAIVDVYDMGQAEDGSPYIVMEILEGEGMDQRLHREGTFRPSEAAAWVSFVARGLQEAHSRGLIHRDLKPGNIFFAADDRGDVIPKILDFGVSKAMNQRTSLVQTMQGTVLGSPAYMSPEQARGDLDIDGRSDVWALGVILYEAITGRAPFDASNYNALMVAIITQPHTPISEIVPGCPPELIAVIDAALEKDRDQRIGSARDLADQLEQVLMNITGTSYLQFQPKASIFSVRPPPPPAPVAPNATSQGPWSDVAPTVRRPAAKMKRRLLAGVGIAAALFVAGGAAALSLGGGDPALLSSRAGTLVEAAVVRAHDRVAAVRAEALAEAKLREVQQQQQQQQQQQGGPKEEPSLDKPTPKKWTPKKSDPHGGVDGPGF